MLRRMEQGGKGRTDIAPAAGIEHLLCNFSDPWTEVEGERGSAKSSHPFLTDPAVRQALALLIDRAGIQEQLYGRQGQATANYLNAPSRFRSPNTRWEFNVDKANAVLEQAGWKRGADGIRAKDGKRLKMVYQTSINPVRQKTQAIVKQAAAKAGIEMELKSVVASVYFGSDPGQPGHQLEVLGRPPDVRLQHDERPRAPAVHGPVRLLGDRHEGQQLGGAEQHALAQRGVRPRVEGAPSRRWTRSSGPRSSSG